MRIAYSDREVSAGGLVVSSADSNLVALISHRNRAGREDWCIPKGHPEGDESLEQAAVREVFEETGLKAEIIETLGVISYRFKVGKTRIEKTVHHFLMQQIGGALDATNDPAGEVLDAAWVPLDKLLEVLAHENERKIALQARELLKDA